MNKTGSRILLVLTDGFPYGVGEPWLEDEQNYWHGFDRIYVAPIQLPQNKKAGEHRKLATGIKLLMPVVSDKITRYKTLLRHGIWRHDLHQELCMLLKTGRLNLDCLRAAFGLVAGSCLQASSILRQLRQDGLSPKDEVVCYAYWMYKPAYTAVLLSEVIPMASCVTRCHRYDIYEERNVMSYLSMRTSIFSCMQKIFCICEQGRNYLCEHYKFDYTKIAIAHLGSDDCGVQNYQRQNDSFNIVSCSNLVPVKRVHLIVDAVKLFAFRQPDVKVQWTHYGTGELCEELWERAVNNSPQNLSVDFAGALPHEELLQRMSSSKGIDIFINSSSSEGVPVSIMEALSMGIPALAPDVGGISELIYDNRNGYLLNAELTAEEIAAAMERIYLLSDEQYMSLRDGAREVWQEAWNAAVNYQAFADGLAAL